MFFTLLKIELFKISKRPRTYIAFGALTVLIFLIQLALKANGNEFVGLLLSAQEDTFEIPKFEMLNGYFVCFFILNMLLIHIPLLVALIAGDQISGEAGMGTLRFMVGKPVSRTQIILAKYVASVLYVVLMLFWIALLGLFLSNVLFGTSDLFIGRQFDVIVLEESDIMWRYVLALLFATLGLSVIAALAIMFSVFSDNSIGPIVTATAVVIVCTIIQQLTVPLFEDNVTPWLFTTHMLGWKGFFYPETYQIVGENGGTVIKGSIENVSAIYKSIAILVGYILLFLGIAIWQFRKKDILT
ncbi:MAG: ABC transporter permease subunit [Saprospiraceae bacterium]|nr:ABC transporter permease subunit [Saprospiraceae bacterium]